MCRDHGARSIGLLTIARSLDGGSDGIATLVKAII